MEPRRRRRRGGHPAGLIRVQWPESAHRYIRFQSDSTRRLRRSGRRHRPRDLAAASSAAARPPAHAHRLADVKLLYPCEPPKILAVGRNYKSHLGDRAQPERPEIFYKPITSLQNPGDPIRFPRDATNVHYEGELVLVIGRRVKDASPEEARDAIFGVTCGNDVSERDWQHGPNKDLQWWRAKGADTFGPLGPAIVTGLDYGNLLLADPPQRRGGAEAVHRGPHLRLPHHRELDQPRRHARRPATSSTPAPPAPREAMKPGDVVEVEIEGIGVLRNPVA